MNGLSTKLLALGRRYMRDADRWFGGCVWGNTLGIAKNRAGRRAMAQARRGSLPAVQFARNGAADTLRRRGFVSLPGLYDAGLIGRIAERFSRVIDDPERSHSRCAAGVDPSYSRMLKTPIEQIPDIRLLLNAEIADVVRGYFGSHFKIRTVQAFRNRHVPSDLLATQDVLSDHWHFDATSTDSLDYWILLTDVDPLDGPTHVLDLARTRALIRSGFKSRDHYGIAVSTLEDPAYLQTFEGRAGTGILHQHAATLHRAGIPAPGRHRDVVLLGFMPSAVPIAEDWDAGFRQSA